MVKACAVISSAFSPDKPTRLAATSAVLARDVALLKERGYVLKSAQAADLFPRCAHVESIVTMIREVSL